MRKEKTDKYLKFYDVELHATPAEYYECLHLEDPDITEDHIVDRPNEVFYHLPYQDSDVNWETGNGVLRMFGKILHPSKITIKLIHKEEEHNED